MIYNAQLKVSSWINKGLQDRLKKRGGMYGYLKSFMRLLIDEKTFFTFKYWS